MTFKERLQDFLNLNNELYEKQRSCIDTIYLKLKKAFDKYNIPDNRMKVNLDKKTGYFILIGKENLEEKTDLSTDVLSLRITVDKYQNPELVMEDYRMNINERHKLILPEDVIRAKENIQSYILYGHGKWILP